MGDLDHIILSLLKRFRPKTYGWVREDVIMAPGGGDLGSVGSREKGALRAPGERSTVEEGAGVGVAP